MAQKPRMRDHSINQRSHMSWVVLAQVWLTGCDRELVEQLAGDMTHHPADPRNNLVAEQRMFVISQQLPQDRRNRADQCVAVRQLIAQDQINRDGRKGLGSILAHARVIVRLG